MNAKKLLLHEKVEVRQFEEGLRGSWHPGVIIGVPQLSRSVEYEELLAQTGSSKLIESIPVSEAIEGLHRRCRVSSTYRGHIRPLPPKSAPDFVKSKLNFGVCVDAFFNDAWWEGVIFDGDVDSDERFVYFPDEGDECKFSVSDLRISHVWDEHFGQWKERGVWILVEFVNEIEEGARVSHFIKRVWDRLHSNYGFLKMISEWTCNIRSQWNRSFKEVVDELSTESTLEDLNHIPASLFGKRSKLKFSQQIKSESGLSAIHVEYPNGVNPIKSRSNKKQKTSLDQCNSKNQLRGRHHSAVGISCKCGCATAEYKCNQLSNGCGCLGKEKLKPTKATQTIEKNFKAVKQKLLIAREAESNHNRSKLTSKIQNGSDTISDVSLLQSKKNGKEEFGISMSRNDFIHENKRKMSKVSSSKRRTQLVQKSSALKKSNTIVTIKHKINRHAADNLSIVNEASDISHEQDNQSATASKGRNITKNSIAGGKLRLKDLVSPVKRKRKRKNTHRQSDPACIICQDGGDLILCDRCPTSYHMNCIQLKDVSDGIWFCPLCCCGLCGLRTPNSENQLFSDICHQCSRQYHLDCLSKAGETPLETFCGIKCFELSQRLHQLIGISYSTNVKGLTWKLIRPSTNIYDSRNTSRIDTRVELSRALEIMHECFQPVVDPHTKRDLVRDVIFNSISKFRRLDFRGFYVMVLQKGSEMVSVATIRIHGQKVAEMPLIATPFSFRRQGMCRLLMEELEKMLTQLGVESLVLPAISQLSETWKSSFNFLEMSNPQRLEFIGYPFLCFYGTIMFQKALGNRRPIKATGGIDSGGAVQELGRYNLRVSQKDQIGSDVCKKFGLCYFRKAKMGKENLVGCRNENESKCKCVYKRRRILAN